MHGLRIPAKAVIKKTGMSGIIQNSAGIPEWARLTHGTKIPTEMIIIMQHSEKVSLI